MDNKKFKNKIDYVLTLDSFFDFKYLKYRKGGNRGFWYLDVETVLERMNAVLGPYWSYKIERETFTNNFMSITCSIEVNAPKNIYKSAPEGINSSKFSISGASYDAKLSKKQKEAGQTIGDMDSIAKIVSSNAFKKAASFYGVGWYLYNTKYLTLLEKACTASEVGWGKYIVSPSIDYNSQYKLIEDYDVQKMLELKALFTGTDKEWNDYVNSVSFWNIKEFLMDHANVTYDLWRNIR